jgi:hypothetical protein
MPSRPPLTFEIPPGAHPTECRGCGQLIYWIKPKEKPMPVNPDGTSHFSNCPNAAEFRRKK